MPVPGQAPHHSLQPQPRSKALSGQVSNPSPMRPSAGSWSCTPTSLGRPFQMYLRYRALTGGLTTPLRARCALGIIGSGSTPSAVVTLAPCRQGAHCFGYSTRASVSHLSPVQGPCPTQPQGSGYRQAGNPDFTEGKLPPPRQPGHSPVRWLLPSRPSNPWGRYWHGVWSLSQEHGKAVLTVPSDQSPSHPAGACPGIGAGAGRMAVCLGAFPQAPQSLSI